MMENYERENVKEKLPAKCLYQSEQNSTKNLFDGNFEESKSTINTIANKATHFLIKGLKLWLNEVICHWKKLVKALLDGRFGIINKR